MTDEEMQKKLEEFGYHFVRKLPTGEWAGVHKMLFTTGLFVGLDETGYRTRFCYETFDEAAIALIQWSGEGMPPGWWVKQKPEEIDGPKRE